MERVIHTSLFYLETFCFILRSSMHQKLKITQVVLVILLVSMIIFYYFWQSSKSPVVLTEEQKMQAIIELTTAPPNAPRPSAQVIKKIVDETSAPAPKAS